MEKRHSIWPLDSVCRKVLNKNRLNIKMEIFFTIGHKRIADILIKSGANVNSEGNTEETPLHSAVLHGELLIITIQLSSREASLIQGHSAFNVVHRTYM